MQKLSKIKFRSKTVTICYARNGRRLYDGLVSDIPSHLLKYYVSDKIYNKVRKNTYIEVVEDEIWDM